MTKTTWDQNFIFLMLFDDNFKQKNRHLVPDSTLDYWVKHKLKHLKGRDFAPFDPKSLQSLHQIYSNKKLFALAKASAHANKRFLQILDSLDSKKRKFLLQPFKKEISNTFYLISNFVSKEKAYQLLGINSHFIHYQKDVRICSTSSFGKCVKRHPLQMLTSEVDKIKSHFSLLPFKFWQKSSVYWEMKRKADLFCSISTFYRVTSKLGIKTTRAFQKPKPIQTLNTQSIFEVIHMDVSRIPVNNRYFYLYSIVDNYSSKVLSHSVQSEVNSSHSLAVLLDACRKYKLHFEPGSILITDGGSEFKKYLNRFIEFPCINIIKKVAYTDIHTSNNKIEAMFRQLKSHHLRLNGDENLEAVRKAIDHSIEEYSNKYIHSLGGISPNEKFSGFNLDMDHIKRQHQQAIEFRKTENRKLACGKCT